MWAMIPMLRVFSRVNLRGMGRIFLCLLANVPDSGQKNGPGRPVATHGGRPEGLGYVSRVSIRSGPAGGAHTCAAGPAAMSHGSSAFPACAGRPLGFRAVSTPLRIALL